MPPNPPPLRRIVDALAGAYGRPRVEEPVDPFEMILSENVAYLVPDSQREAAFRALRERVGTLPRQILAAPREVLLDAIRDGGMHPEDRVERVIRCAELASRVAGGDLKKALRQSPSEGGRILREFPGIGEPGMEKILLFTRNRPTLALESNGLRVLLRVGFGEEKKGYAATYRSVQEATGIPDPPDYLFLMEAHLLLRRHGREICRRNPLCSSCPLRGECRYYRTAAGDHAPDPRSTRKERGPRA